MVRFSEVLGFLVADTSYFSLNCLEFGCKFESRCWQPSGYLVGLFLHVIDWWCCSQVVPSPHVPTGQDEVLAWEWGWWTGRPSFKSRWNLISSKCILLFILVLFFGESIAFFSPAPEIFHQQSLPPQKKRTQKAAPSSSAPVKLDRGGTLMAWWLVKLAFLNYVPFFPPFWRIAFARKKSR